jgi:hypothetical protein
MIRKTIFALAAIATISATALVPTEASAKNWKGGNHIGRWAVGTAVVLGTAAALTAYADCYYVWGVNRRGEPVRVRTCD